MSKVVFQKNELSRKPGVIYFILFQFIYMSHFSKNWEPRWLTEKFVTIEDLNINKFKIISMYLNSII